MIHVFVEHLHDKGSTPHDLSWELLHFMSSKSQMTSQSGSICPRMPWASATNKNRTNPLEESIGRSLDHECLEDQASFLPRRYIDRCEKIERQSEAEWPEGRMYGSKVWVLLDGVLRRGFFVIRVALMGVETGPQNPPIQPWDWDGDGNHKYVGGFWNRGAPPCRDKLWILVPPLEAPQSHNASIRRQEAKEGQDVTDVALARDAWARGSGSSHSNTTSAQRTDPHATRWKVSVDTYSLRGEQFQRNRTAIRIKESRIGRHKLRLLASYSTKLGKD